MIGRRSRTSAQARPGVAVTSLQALTVFGLWLAPRVANACPVCFQAQNEENRIAFVVSTAFLSLLPLGMIAGIILWVRRKVIRQHALESEYLRSSVRHGTANSLSAAKDPAG